VALGWLKRAIVGRAPKRALYLFLDEGGDLNFRPTGSRFFTMTSIAKTRPFNVSRDLEALKFDLMEEGEDIEYFHASEDRQRIRDRVFKVIRPNLGRRVIDAVVVEKRKTHPSLRPVIDFYPKMLSYLLDYALRKSDLRQTSEVIIVTDALPLNEKRKVFEKTIRSELKAKLPSGVPFRVMHHASKSCFGLQIADYCNWAIYRRWQKGDTRSYDLIRHGIRSEFDIFRTGATHFY
jgi:uncharacterized protein DUF3800